MFKITEETRNAAIEAMKEIFLKADDGAKLGDYEIGQAFDVAVDIVKKQFGM
jgi:hypothetical protein